LTKSALMLIDIHRSSDAPKRVSRLFFKNS